MQHVNTSASQMLVAAAAVSQHIVYTQHGLQSLATAFLQQGRQAIAACGVDQQNTWQ